MQGSGIAKQIGWDQDESMVQAWEHSRTGYPWIDAAMTQLREQGWLHHLARHAVACFLTRGDLYQNWEQGAKVFDKYLLDSDWAINNGNWLWLSASAYFHQFFRVYSPVAFPKKTDKKGAYIRKWLPQFKTFPDKYIYEPWKAPQHVQLEHGVVVGESYPARIVVHEEVSKRNISRHSDAYKAHKAGHTGGIPSSISGVGATQVASSPPPAQMRPGEGCTAFPGTSEADTAVASNAGGDMNSTAAHTVRGSKRTSASPAQGEKRGRSKAARTADVSGVSSAKQPNKGGESDRSTAFTVSDDSE
jgi:cryptochrome